MMIQQLQIELIRPIEKDWDYTTTVKGTEYQPPTVVVVLMLDNVLVHVP
jgi:hypothetical protein